jgi:hypothetical protein
LFIYGLRIGGLPPPLAGFLFCAFAGPLSFAKDLIPLLVALDFALVDLLFLAALLFLIAIVSPVCFYYPLYAIKHSVVAPIVALTILLKHPYTISPAPIVTLLVLPLSKSSPITLSA